MTVHVTHGGLPPRRLACLYPITFFSGTIIMSLGPVLDPIIQDLNLPLSRAGLLAAGFAAGRVVALLALNIFLAKVSLKWLVVGAATLQAVGLAFAAVFVRSLGPLVAALAVVGAAATIPMVVPVMWIGAYAKRDTERAMLLVWTFFALGVVVSPLAIGAALAMGAGWKGVFLGEALFSVLMAIVVTVLPLVDVPGRQNVRWRQLRETVASAPRLLALMLLGMFLYVGAEHVPNIWLAEFQVETFGAAQGTAAVALALFFGGMMVGRYLCVPLARRLVASRILAVSGSLMAAFILLTAFAPSLVISQICVFMTGLGGSAAYPMLSSYINRFPTAFSGLVFSIITLVSVSSGAAFAYGAGPVAQALGTRVAIAIAAAPAAAVVLLSFFLPGRLPGRDTTLSHSGFHADPHP